MAGIRRLDLISALALLLVSALVAGATFRLPYWTTFTPGPAFAPFWLAGAGALIGVVLLVQALRSRSDEAVEWPDRAGARQVALGIAALWLLLVMLPILGALLASIVFMLAFLLVVERRPLVPSLLTTAITVGLFEIVFTVWLNVRLPGGILGF